MRLLITLAAASLAAAASAAPTRFEKQLARSVAFLESASQYRVDVSVRWRVEAAGKTTTGTKRCRLTYRKPGRFRVEVRHGGSRTPDLVCVSDGRTVTRTLTGPGLVSRDRAADPRAAFRKCAFTLTAVDGSGIDVLLAPDLRNYVAAQATGVRYLGATRVGRTPVERYRMTWGGDRVVELWVETGAKPVLRRIRRTKTLPSAGGQPSRLEIVSDLSWDFDAEVGRGVFGAPAGRTRQVDDLFAALASGGGTPAKEPARAAVDELTVRRVTGRPLTLQLKRGKPTVLLFWSVSSDDGRRFLPRAASLLRAYARRGVRLYAVSVRDSRASVQRYAEREKPGASLLLDSTGKAMRQCGVTSPGSAVLLDGDGVVVATVDVGARTALADLKRRLDGLLAGR